MLGRKDESEMNSRGRPTILTPELSEELLDRVANGELLWRICLDDHMPDKSTVHRWRRKNSEFADEYRQAARIGCESQLDDLDRVARDGSGDIIVSTEDGERVERVDHENIQRSKLICDSIKWRLSKVKPEIYGERTSHQVFDERGDPSKPSVVVIVDGVKSE